MKGLTKVYCFSEGVALQYKNRKHFFSLHYHDHDLGIDAMRHFFATSHGKGACNWIGGTIKRLVRKESLQNPYEEQIVTLLFTGELL
jgi:hypothetical protein